MKSANNRLVLVSALLSTAGLVAVLPQRALAEESSGSASEVPGKGTPEGEKAPASAAPAPAPAADTTKKVETPTAARPPAAPEWTFQLRAGLGGGRIASEKSFKSDRLGAGVYAGKRFADLDLSLPFLDINNTSIGAAYFTFSGVDSSADLNWSAQSLGAQVSLGAAPFETKLFDLLLQGGVAVQRLVSQEPLRMTEKAKYGAGLTGGAFARTQILDGVQLSAGVDLVLGSATWFGGSLGLESSF
ncbi:MAG: hypothetical protein RI953_1442 [Pseudomonadota bacterium]